MILSTALALLTPVAAHQPESFVPKFRAGVTRTHAISIESTTVLTGQTQFRDGHELPADVTPKVQQEQASSRSCVIVDAIESIEGSGPGSVLRTFQDVSGAGRYSVEIEAPSGGGGLREADAFQLSSPLMEQSVRYRPGADGMLAHPAAESSVEAELLKELPFEVGPEFLLPFEPTRIGQTWSMPADSVGELLALGGELYLERADDGTETPAGAPAIAEERAFKGRVELEFLDSYSAGPRVAVIAIRVDVTETSSLKPRIEAPAAGAPPGGAPVPTEAATSQSAHHLGEGKLLFDLERGLVQGLELDMKSELEATHVVRVPVPKQGEMEMKTVETSKIETAISYRATEK